MTGEVFVTGATGVLGRPTVRALVASGRSVRAVARTDAKAAELRLAGAQPVTVDLFDTDAVKSATEGCVAILHLATNIPHMRDMRKPDAWTTNSRLRMEATAHLVDAAHTHGIDTVVKESITFAYPDRGSEWIDETVAVTADHAVMRDTVDAERLVEDFTAGGGRGIVMRFGAFIAAEAHHTDSFLQLARRHVAPFPGRAGAYASSVHCDDAATAVVAALDAPAGIYNVVDDEPLTRRELADAFAAASGFGHLFIVPPSVVKLVGRSSGDYVLRSQRVANGKFRGATGWAPAYPSAREGWVAVAASRAVSGATSRG